MVGLSIHIGINFVDKNHYNGWDGKLENCVNDAQAMQKIANNVGFKSISFFDSEATSFNFLSQMRMASETLETGDMLFISYAGHGAQVVDLDGDEVDDSLDETWVFHDRMLLDDELHRIYSAFKSGVRIFVVSDSCHSGTMWRAIVPNQQHQEFGAPGDMKYRFMPSDVSRETLEHHKWLYRSLQLSGPPSSQIDIKASIIYISGCSDNQTSGDGPPGTNGVFTGKILKAWGSGEFSGGYKSFYKKVLRSMPPLQTPQFSLIGVPNKSFEAQKPFTI